MKRAQQPEAVEERRGYQALQIVGQRTSPGDHRKQRDHVSLGIQRDVLPPRALEKVTVSVCSSHEDRVDCRLTEVLKQT
jgi:hypothetical protein